VIRRYVSAWAAVAILSGLAGSEPWAQQSALEYEVKAGFLVNFLDFVRWPAPALGSTRTPFTICIVGRDPFGELLERTVSGAAVQGRPVAVRRQNTASNLGTCRVAFFSGSGIRRAPVPQTEGTLMVGEGARFVDQGGHIGFVVDGGHVRFDLNLDAAGASGLTLSSKLTRIARQVIATRH
jgi:hypothetical protein